LILDGEELNDFSPGGDGLRVGVGPYRYAADLEAADEEVKRVELRGRGLRVRPTTLKRTVVAEGFDDLVEERARRGVSTDNDRAGPLERSIRVLPSWGLGGSRMIEGADSGRRLPFFRLRVRATTVWPIAAANWCSKPHAARRAGLKSTAGGGRSPHWVRAGKR